MRGICSIDSCNYKTGSKVHEEFEGLDGINICWECGDKILAAVKIARGNGLPPARLPDGHQPVNTECVK